MLVVFTDLDGTLLDAESYSFDAARPALARLHQQRIPLILTTSKTRAEVESLRVRLQNADPFIVENGAAVFIPKGYFAAAVPGAVSRDAYEVIEFGHRYDDLVEALAAASLATGCRLRGFHDMTASDIADACGLALDQAALAKAREYDEPFTILDPGRERSLIDEIVRSGRRHSRGGRFHHITGNNDKGAAVRVLTSLFRAQSGEVTTMALGDAPNDVEMLDAADIPVWVTGPPEWNEAVLGVLRSKMTPQ